MTNELTIILDADHLDVETLANSLKKTVDVLHSLETNLTRLEAIEWDIVRTSMNSPLTVTISPRSNGVPAPSHASRVAEAFLHGLQELSLHATIPDGFDEVTIEAARELAEIAVKGNARITINAPNSPAAPANIGPELLGFAQLVEAKAKSHLEIGTVEGILDVVSTRGGRRRFYVTEVLTGAKVECFGSAVDLKEAQTYLECRVSVQGFVRMRFGRPKMIEVKSIKRLRNRGELPKLDDIGPVDLTGGKSPEDFIRELRDV